MPTFPAATLGPIVQKDTAKVHGAAAIIYRALRAVAMGLALMVALGACSTVRLAYKQTPTLAYWWIDDFVDLSDAQSTTLRKDINAFFTWHQTQELPEYANRLKQWQAMARQDTTGEQSCQQFEVLRAAYLRSAERAIEPLTRLALNLQQTQLEHLSRHHAKSNLKFTDEWLEGGPKKRQNRLFDRALDRYETLYGELNSSQRAALKARTQSSAFDPQRVHTERQRRQADLLASLKKAQAQPAEAAALLRQWHARTLTSPDPAYAAYAKGLIRDACEQYAALHNSTSPEQRTHAVETLQNYETDLRALLRSD
jgi:hypothetical protein